MGNTYWKENQIQRSNDDMALGNQVQFPQTNRRKSTPSSPQIVNRKSANSKEQNLEQFFSNFAEQRNARENHAQKPREEQVNSTHQINKSNNNQINNSLNDNLMVNGNKKQSSRKSSANEDKAKNNNHHNNITNNININNTSSNNSIKESQLENQDKNSSQVNTNLDSIPIQSNSGSVSWTEEAHSQIIRNSSYLSNLNGWSYTSEKSEIDNDLINVFYQQGPSSYISSRVNSEIDLTNSRTNSYYSQYQNDYELNFYRDGEEIRKSYIAKLICKKVWTPSQKEKSHNSLIIFDWDDTLLCTSFLTPGGVFDENIKLTEKDKEKWAKLEFSVWRLLSAAIEKGDVFIITNAGPGWVEYSAEKFYPSVLTVLNKIKIISARGEYEAKYPNDSRKWKIETFLNLKKVFSNDLVTNIICLGDSIFEMEAGHILASKYTQAFIKTVKFRENPKPEELNKQLRLVADQFPAIISAVKNLTIRVEKRKSKNVLFRKV